MPDSPAIPQPLAGAVFLSYASQDAAVATRICEALRAGGVEVWFDQDALVGGDTWDQKIRGQITACALFMPVISANTQAREEGYFRLEWKLAEDRSHLMAKGKAFIVPVTVDATTERGALVPDAFRAVQWTKLPGGETPAAFVTRVQKLLSPPSAMEPGRPRPGQRDEGVASPAETSDPDTGWKARATPEVGRRVPVAAWSVAAILAVVVIGVLVWRRAPESAPSSAANAGAGPRSPTTETSVPSLGEKSIAVLPFGSMSSDKENESFADGVHEDVITGLAKIRDLKVISRPSVLAYRDTTSRNLKKIAAELGVAHVLVGSVRRAGNTVRVTAQLIDVRTDENRWAESYDGELTDIFALQAKLAQQIAGALKATLTPGERTLIERRPTQNQEAYDLYLRARAMQQDVGERGSLADYQRIVGIYEQAIARDPAFALAQAQVALVHSIMYWFGFLDPTPGRAELMKAAVDAAVRLAPDAPETHLAVGAYRYRVQLDWKGALAEFRLAAEGLPNDAQLSFWLAITHRRLGRWVEAVGDFERSVALNPRDFAAVQNYSIFLNTLRRWDQARLTCGRFLAFFPGDSALLGGQAQTQFALRGDHEAFAFALEKLPINSLDPDSLLPRVKAAMIRGDLASADRILAGASRKTLGVSYASSVVSDPVALWRARVAFLRGEGESARRFAAEATTYYRGTRWNARQLPWAGMRLAETAALAGRAEQAIPEAEAALAELTAQDAYGVTQVRVFLGEVYLMAGRSDQALAVLRQMMSEPCNLSPNDFRISPLWSRLQGDPRFEEILKSAKPL